MASIGIADTIATAVRLDNQGIMPTRRVYGLGGDALCASAVQDNLVSGELKAWWCEATQVAGTPVNLKHPVTGATMEVMMVAQVRRLVARRAPRNLHQVGRPIVEHRSECAVDSGEAKPRHAPPRLGEDFRRRKRVGSPPQDLVDCVALTCPAFHAIDDT